MVATAQPPAWPATRMVDGYVLRSHDVQGRMVGDLARMLGFDPAYVTTRFGAIYSLPILDGATAAAITAVGYNDDRKTKEDYNRPSLVAGLMNRFDSPDPNLAAEFAALYANRGMLIKFVFVRPNDLPPGFSRRIAMIALTPPRFDQSYPKGAGIREFVLHRPTPFRLLWTFSGADRLRRIP